MISLTDERDKPTVEHMPNVVDHWNSEGNNTDQPNRIKYYHFKGREDEAKVVPFSVNRDEAEGGTYTPNLGADFKEPGER